MDHRPLKPKPESLILWDVIEEHLDEAAFLSTQWEQALVSPLYKLEEVRDRVEERMLAHVDGLVVGGPLVAERVLKPALVDGTQGATFAAALALLAESRPDSEAAVLDALCTVAAPQAHEVQRALELCPSKHRQVALLQLRSSDQPRVRAAAARILGFQRVDLGPLLHELLDPGSEELFLAGLYCLRYLPRQDGEFAIRQALASSSEAVVAAGLLAGAVGGLWEVLDVARSLIRNQHPATPTAALLLGLVGSGADAKLLHQVVAEKEHAAAGIFALGLGGARDTADACVQWLRNPALASAASEAFLTITGADAEKEQLALPASTDPEPELDSSEREEDLSSAPESVLLCADAVEAWWQKRGREFSAAEPYFLGRPFDRRDAKAWLSAMERATMRQRSSLALGLAIHTQGQVQLQTGELTRVQVAQKIQLPAR